MAGMRSVVGPILFFLLNVPLPARALPPLDYLLAPAMNASQFFLTRFERPLPLHVAGRNEGYYDALLRTSLLDVQHLLALQRLAAPVPLLADPNTGRSQAGCEYVKTGFVHRPSYGSAAEAYLDGSTIVCHLLGAFWPPVAQFAAALSDQVRDIACVWQYAVMWRPPTVSPPPTRLAFPGAPTST